MNVSCHYPVAALETQGVKIVDEVVESGEPAFLLQAGYVRAAVVPADQYLADMQALHEFERIYGRLGAPRTHIE